MSDLVERLRFHADSWSGDDAHQGRIPKEEAALADEAADEIEKLRAAALHACDVFVEPFGSKNPDKTIGDWRAEMLSAMRELRALLPPSPDE